MIHQNTIDETTSPEKEKAAKKSTWVSIVINLVMSTLQIVVGIFTHAQSLVADGIHSLSDLIADFVVLHALKHSKKEADDDHHYGHRRYENIASLILGAILIVVGLGMFWNSVVKLQDTDSIKQVSQIALWIAVAAILSKELLFRYMRNIALKVNSKLLMANAWHARSDAASSLVVAIGLTGNLMGYTLLDPIAALFVGAMIVKMGWKFFKEAMHDLTDGSVDEELLNKFKAELLKINGVKGIHDLKSRTTGDLIMLEVHIEVDSNLTVKEGHDIAVSVREHLLSDPSICYVMTHVDPV